MSTGAPSGWSPGHRHWRINTTITVVSVVIALLSASATIFGVLRSHTPTVRAIVDVPAPSNLPAATKSPEPGSTMCTDDPDRSMSGWGPARPLYDSDSSPYATLDSLWENPNIGDERAFYGVREEGSTAPWSQDLEVKPGKRYVVRAYIHNNAGSDRAVARDVNLAVNLPTCSGLSIGSNAFVKASNTFPNEMWGSITFTSSRTFNLAYVEGSAHLYGNAYGKDGVKIKGTAFLTSAGTLLGSTALDGKVRAGYENALYFTYVVRPQFASS